VTDEVLSPEQLVKRIPYSVQTLAQWRVSGKGPRFAIDGRKIMYLWSSVVEWVKTHEVHNTVEAGSARILKGTK
jgi:hypothetical protein